LFLYFYFLFEDDDVFAVALTDRNGRFRGGWR